MDPEALAVLKDIRRWVKILGLQEAKPLLLDALSHDDEDKQRDLRITYHLTDGEHGTQDIADHIDYSRHWVGDRHAEWSKMGLIERDSPSSSYKNVVSLQEAGIDVPDIPDPDADDEDEEDEEETQSEGDTGEDTEDQQTDGETATEAAISDFE